MYAHTQTFLPRDHGRSIVHLTDPTSATQSCLYFHSAPGFATPVLAYMLDSLVRVSRRVEEKHFVRIQTTLAKAALKARDRPRSPPWQEHRDITATPKCDSPPQALIPQQKPILTYTHHARRPLKGTPKEAGITLLSFPSLSAISGTL